jgi:DNA-binding response OmpR family regulator
MSDTTGPRLLYVEDEPLILDLGVAAFEEAGFSVTAVATAKDALTQLDESGDEFRALITDVDLGGPIDGWQVARHARERFPQMPVIYVSGSSSHDWPVRGVPGSAMLVKPYASAQLVVAVSTAMQASDAPP